MIPSDKQDSVDDVAIDTESRPEWMKFFYKRFSGATEFMTDDQRGWYIKLIVYAAEEGEPAGYLEDDDERLREIAGVKELSTDVATLLQHGANINADALAKMNEKREKRWLSVRNKFRPSNDHPGYIYNKMLRSVLKEAYRKSLFASKAGKASQVVQAKRKEEKRLSTVVEQTLNSLPAEHERPSNRTSIDLEKEEDTKKQRDNTSLSKRLDDRKKAKTLFDEKRFVVTDKMIAHLMEKYNDPSDDTIPEFTIGDINYLAEKFKLTFHGETYRSWSMTFYKFVSNQFTKYGYVPGQYNWRARATNNGRHESSSERNARLEQENAKLFTDEDPANIQDSSQVNDRVNPTRLSLAVDGD